MADIALLACFGSGVGAKSGKSISADLAAIRVPNSDDFAAGGDERFDNVTNDSGVPCRSALAGRLPFMDGSGGQWTLKPAASRPEVNLT